MALGRFLSVALFILMDVSNSKDISVSEKLIEIGFRNGKPVKASHR